MILLDTDVLIDLLRGQDGAVSWLTSLDAEDVFVPGFVVMELIQGCGTRAEQRRVERALARYRVVWPKEDTCNSALHVFTAYRLTSGLGILDAIIGQMAVDLAAPLATFNRKHYSPFSALRTVQPYARG